MNGLTKLIIFIGDRDAGDSENFVEWNRNEDTDRVGIGVTHVF
jgi:hypothetical protein